MASDLRDGQSMPFLSSSHVVGMISTIICVADHLRGCCSAMQQTAWFPFVMQTDR